MNKLGKTKYKLLEDFDEAAQMFGRYQHSESARDEYLDVKGRLEKKLDKMSKRIRDFENRARTNAVSAGRFF